MIVHCSGLQQAVHRAAGECRIHFTHTHLTPPLQCSERARAVDIILRNSLLREILTQRSNCQRKQKLLNTIKQEFLCNVKDPFPTPTCLVDFPSAFSIVIL